QFQFAKVAEPARSRLARSSPDMTAISGSAAAVTGAASGIGRALALELAARGCDLALADRDEAGLQQVAAEIGKAGTRKVSTHPARRRIARRSLRCAAFRKACGMNWRWRTVR